MPGKVGQSFPVDINVGFVQAIDELAVAHVVYAASGIDAGDPQTAELAFFKLTVSKGKGHRAFDSLSGNAICFTPATKIAPGIEHIFFSSTMGGDVISRSWHLISPL